MSNATEKEALKSKSASVGTNDVMTKPFSYLLKAAFPEATKIDTEESEPSSQTANLKCEVPRKPPLIMNELNSEVDEKCSFEGEGLNMGFLTLKQ